MNTILASSFLLQFTKIAARKPRHLCLGMKGRDSIDRNNSLPGIDSIDSRRIMPS